MTTGRPRRPGPAASTFASPAGDLAPPSQGPIGSCDTWPGVVMHRRDFMKLAGSGVSMGALAETVVSAEIAQSPPPAAAPAGKARMKVGTQNGDSDDLLRAFAAFGVNNI